MPKLAFNAVIFALKVALDATKFPIVKVLGTTMFNILLLLSYTVELPNTERLVPTNRLGEYTCTFEIFALTTTLPVD